MLNKSNSRISNKKHKLKQELDSITPLDHVSGIFIARQGRKKNEANLFGD